MQKRISWKQGTAQEAGIQTGGDGEYLQWSDGQLHELVLLENEFGVNRVHWVDGQGVDCTGPECRLCEVGDQPRVRFVTRVWWEDREASWEMSTTVHDRLVAICQELEGMRLLQLKVRRRGTGLETEYHLVPGGFAERDPSEIPVDPPGSRPAGTTGRAAGPRGYDDRMEALAVNDPQGAAAYAKELAASLEETGREALQALEKRYPQWYAGASQTERLVGLLTDLERRVDLARTQALDERSGAELGLDDLLG